MSYAVLQTQAGYITLPLTTAQFGWLRQPLKRLGNSLPSGSVRYMRLNASPFEGTRHILQIDLSLDTWHGLVVAFAWEEVAEMQCKVGQVWACCISCQGCRAILVCF